jgi:hypothetical protein
VWREEQGESPGLSSGFSPIFICLRQIPGGCPLRPSCSRKERMPTPVQQFAANIPSPPVRLALPFPVVRVDRWPHPRVMTSPFYFRPTAGAPADRYHTSETQKGWRREGLLTTLDDEDGLEEGEGGVISRPAINSRRARDARRHDRQEKGGRGSHLQQRQRIGNPLLLRFVNSPGAGHQVRSLLSSSDN